MALFFAVVPSVAAKISMIVLIVSIITFGAVPKIMVALGCDMEDVYMKVDMHLYRLALLTLISLSLTFMIYFTSHP